MRIALSSGLTRKQVADDLGVGMSTLNKWIMAYRDTDVVSKEDLDLAQENERLRRENRILKEEREVLKKATVFFASQTNPVTSGLRVLAITSLPRDAKCGRNVRLAHTYISPSAILWVLPVARSVIKPAPLKP